MSTLPYYLLIRVSGKPSFVKRVKTFIVFTERTVGLNILSKEGQNFGFRDAQLLDLRNTLTIH